MLLYPCQVPCVSVTVDPVRPRVQVIPELQHELRVLHDEVKGMRNGQQPQHGDVVNG